MIELSNPNIFKTACYIDGQWQGRPETDVIDPASGEMIVRVPNLGADQAQAAVAAAARAFPLWATRTGKERSIVLRRWFDLVLLNCEDLARILTSEQGKPLSEARAEIAYAAAYIEFYAEEAKRLNGEILSSHRSDARTLVTRQPIGVVGAITPWNFPAAMITRKVAPALAAGCSVVVKPAPETPLTAFALAHLAELAGLPAGLLNVITGDAKAIGGVLTAHKSVRAVSFTGSTPVGKLLAGQASTTVKRVLLELGGNAPFIVFDDADIDAAISGAMSAKFRNSGQTCVCANRFYVQSGIHDLFVRRLHNAMLDLKVGSGFDTSVNQGPLINAAAVDKTERHVADAVTRGAQLVLGGSRLAGAGYYYAPTLLTGARPEMLVAQEETFGPIAPIFRFETEEQVIEAANDSDTGLAAYVYTRDIGRVFRVTERLEYGMVGINTGIISSEFVPFGGVKESGDGREGSRHGIDAYTTLKYSLIAGI